MSAETLLIIYAAVVTIAYAALAWEFHKLQTQCERWRTTAKFWRGRATK